MMNEETQITMLDSDGEGVQLLIHTQITVPWVSLYQMLDREQGREPVEVSL